MMSKQQATDIIVRSGPEEREYLLRRAESHLQLGEKTNEMGSKLIHLRLHRLYKERAETLRMVLSY